MSFEESKSKFKSKSSVNAFFFFVSFFFRFWGFVSFRLTFSRYIGVNVFLISSRICLLYILRVFSTGLFNIIVTVIAADNYILIHKILQNLPLFLTVQTLECSYNKKHIFRILLFQILVSILEDLKSMKFFQIRSLLFAIGWSKFFKRFVKRFQDLQAFVYVF